MRAATVALVVQLESGSQKLIDTLSDDREIEVLEKAFTIGADNPLQKVYEHRRQVESEDGEFADYVEDLISHPFQKPEIKEHGVQWLRSKMKIEQYQRSESDAAKVIAQYAFEVFSQDLEKKDFFLAGPSAQVRIRVFVLPESQGLSNVA